MEASWLPPPAKAFLARLAFLYADPPYPTVMSHVKNSLDPRREHVLIFLAFDLGHLHPVCVVQRAEDRVRGYRAGSEP